MFSLIQFVISFHMNREPSQKFLNKVEGEEVISALKGKKERKNAHTLETRSGLNGLHIKRALRC